MPFIFQGTSGDDVFVGQTSDGNIFNLWQGGDDTATGAGYGDLFKMRAALTAADRLDGDSNFDVVSLNGDYSAGLTLDALTVVNVEVFQLHAGFDYSLTTADGTVASGANLKVIGGRFGAGDQLTFDGSAELDGSFEFRTGRGSDTVTGGAMNDTFYLRKGGDDSADGGAGDDTFRLNKALTAADSIDGGGGADTLILDGNYTGANAVVMNVTSFEYLTLTEGRSYDLTAADTVVETGATLQIELASLSGSDELVFDGSAETDGSYSMLSGAGDDTLTGGASNDTLTGGSGGDTLGGGGGADVFAYSGASESNSSAIDVIVGLDLNADKFDLPIGIGGVAVQSGSVSEVIFDANMGSICSDYVCSIVNVTGGDLIGKSYLVINADTGDGFQYVAGDYVMDITGFTGTLDTGDFI